MLSRARNKLPRPLLLLALLVIEPRHGSVLSKMIEAKSQGVVKVYAASLCALLYPLERKRWIAGSWVERPGQRRRRYYRFTSEGNRQLAAQREGFARFATAVSAIAGVRYA